MIINKYIPCKILYLSLVISFYLTTPIFLIASDYCIILKSGKIILVDDHWENIRLKRTLFHEAP